MYEKESVCGKFLCACPFCAGELATALNPEGEPIGIIHALPPCQRFRELEPDVFMAAVNQRRGN